MVKRKTTSDYHYSVENRFNDEHCIDACAAALSLSEPDYAYIESESAISYFPGLLRPLYHLFAFKHKVLCRP